MFVCVSMGVRLSLYSIFVCLSMAVMGLCVCVTCHLGDSCICGVVTPSCLCRRPSDVSFLFSPCCDLAVD